MLLSGLVAMLFAQPGLEKPDLAFEAGHFSEAARLYEQYHKQMPSEPRYLVRLGQIALYENRFADVDTRERQALKLDPANQAAKAIEAESFYRQDKFGEAIPFLRDLKHDGEADEFQALEGKMAYETPADFRRVDVPFTQLDPLPVVEVKLNGSAPSRFFIDTGGAELIVDNDKAAELGLKTYGGGKGTFAGGKQADLQRAIVDSVDLNGLQVRNVPAMTLDLSNLGLVLGGKIDGCVGTVFLYHFLSTIDYVHRRLTLQPKGSRFHSEGQTVRIPFWMSGTHTMVAWGHLNDAPEHLFFIDTGLAGSGVNAPKETLDEAKIKLDDGPAATGYGGGGAVQFRSFTVQRVTLGPITEADIGGVYDGNFVMGKMSPFQIAGLISHQFFRPYELTFDFDHMQMLLTKPK